MTPNQNIAKDKTTKICTWYGLNDTIGNVINAQILAAIEEALVTAQLHTLKFDIPAALQDTKRLDALRELMGYTQDGSHQTVKLYEDDATMDFCISAGKKHYYASGIRSVIDEVINGNKTS
jgi:hypothetical protein